MYIIRNLKRNSDCIKMTKIEKEVDIIPDFLQSPLPQNRSQNWRLMHVFRSQI